MRICINSFDFVRACRLNLPAGPEVQPRGITQDFALFSCLAISIYVCWSNLNQSPVVVEVAKPDPIVTGRSSKRHLDIRDSPSRAGDSLVRYVNNDRRSRAFATESRVPPTLLPYRSGPAIRSEDRGLGFIACPCRPSKASDSMNPTAPTSSVVAPPANDS